MIKRDKTFYRIVVLTVLNVLAIYLFVSAPPRLPEASARTAEQGPRIPIAALLTAVYTINSEARRIYTAKVVGSGKEAGLAFKETWADKDVQAGPLPALFFRLVASELTKFPEPLSAFLGSDAAINPSNKFTGEQTERFVRIKRDRAPQIFVDSDKQQVGMFADVASAQPCVTCHNEHQASPKKDWKLNDVMGAATWIYPDPDVSTTEFLKLTGNVYASVSAAWTIYLAKTTSFNDPPRIGRDWPGKGRRALPDAKTFLAEVYQASAPKILKILNDQVKPPKPPALGTQQARLETPR